MKPADCTKLENDNDFKRSYAKRLPWWRNFLFVAPSLILFIGLAGVLFLSKADMLLSWYTLPFLLLFAAGTIWLKAVKRHIQKTLVAKKDAFRVCLASLVEDEGKYLYFVFNRNGKRHNLYAVESFAELLRKSEVEMRINKDAAKKAAVAVTDSSTGESFAMIALLRRDIRRCNAAWTEREPLPLLYVDDRKLFIINKKKKPKI